MYTWQLSMEQQRFPEHLMYNSLHFGQDMHNDFLLKLTNSKYDIAITWQVEVQARTLLGTIGTIQLQVENSYEICSLGICILIGSIARNSELLVRLKMVQRRTCCVFNRSIVSS